MLNKITYQLDIKSEIVIILDGTIYILKPPIKGNISTGKCNCHSGKTYSLGKYGHSID